MKKIDKTTHPATPKVFNMDNPVQATFKAALLALVTYLFLFGNVPMQAQNITKPKIACPSNIWVNSYNGVMFYQRLELQYPNRSMPLQLTFYYNSSSLNQNFGYGTGWSLGYEMRYEVDSLGIVIVRGDGRRDLFKKYGTLFESPAGVFDKLSQDGDKYILAGKQGDKYHLGDTIHPVIEKIEDRYGNYLMFSYTDKLLSAITDNQGRSLNFTWNDSLLIKTGASFDTHEYTYQYDTLKQLVRVVNPMGFSTAYGYDARGLLNEITDPNGNKTQIFYNGDYSVSRVKTDLTDKSIRYENMQTVVIDYVEPTNQFTTYRWDDKGRVVEKKGHCCGRQQTMEYDDNDNVIKRTDANGNATFYTYDLEGNMLTATDPLSYMEKYTYESNFNQITSYTDKKGNTTNYSYDGNGNLMSVNNPLSQTLEFTYDNFGQMLTYKDAKGNITHFSNDTYGNVTAITDAESHTIGLSYDTRGNITTLTDAMGNTTQYEYNKQNLPVKLINALGQNTLVAYDKNGNRLSITDPLLRKTTYKYNELGDVTEVKDPLNQTTQYVRNAKSLITQMTDALDGKTHLLYDDMDQISMTINAENDTIRYFYDIKGNLTGIIQQGGGMLQYNYNENDQVVSISDNAGLIAEYIYDANGNITTEKDGEGKETHYEYDILNRVIKITDPLGFFEQYEYDANNKLTKLTHKNGTVETFTYNALNQLTEHKDAMNNITYFTYDNNNNLSSVTDANNHATQYQYDALKRNTLITFADNSTKQYWYDAAGNVQKYKDNAGNVMTYTYDALNRLTQKLYPNNSSDQYTYNALGQMLTAVNTHATVNFTYDHIGRILSETLNGKTTTYHYNTTERLRSITYPGGRAIQEFYDTRNRLSHITEGSETLVTMQYNANNQMLQRTYSNGTTTNFTYNDAGLLTHIIDAPAISDVSMEYDPNGNMLYRKDNLYPDRSETYAYDNLQRLTQFKRGVMSGTTIPTPLKSITYGMDALGNRTIVTEDDVNTNYTAGSMNQYTAITGALNATPTYDGNGNMLNDHQHNYTYDYNNRMTGVDNDNTAIYLYDALGRRIQKQTAEGTVDYFYDGDHIVETWRAASSDATYLYGNWVDDILQMNRDGNDYFYHKNHLGSVMALSGTNGTMAESYQYQPYGKPEFYNALQNPITVSALQNDILFTGRQWETESGLYYYRARHLSSELGRFLQHDPLGYIERFNQLAYVINNPINLIDPMGFVSETTVKITSGTSLTFGAASTYMGWYVDKMRVPAYKLEYFDPISKQPYSTGGHGNPYNIFKWGGPLLGGISTTLNASLTYNSFQNSNYIEGAYNATGTVASGAATVGSLTGLGVGLSQWMITAGQIGAAYGIGNLIGTGINAIWGDEIFENITWPLYCMITGECEEDKWGDWIYDNLGGDWIWNNMTMPFLDFLGWIGIPAFDPFDPNEIIGTEGYDSLQWVSVNQVLAYTIYFENDSEFATASAQRVEVRLPLHTNMDRNSFGLGSFGFGSLRFELNGRPPFYQQRLDVRDSLGVFVDVTAGIDIVAQEAFWVFETIDPASGLPPIGVHEGFLPVNDPDLHNGEGFVSFFIKPHPACVTGDTITAEASIVFDINEAIPTNVWKNTIDAVAPQSTLMATVAATEVEISFTAQDDPGGCGEKEIQLYVAINDEPYELAGTYPIDTTIYYPYTAGNTYRLYTSALDHVRNKEEFKPVPDFILNETLPPTNISLSNNTFYNYEEQGGTIGVLSTTDKISNQNFTYTLVAGNGSTNNTMFDIENDKLVINHNFYCSPDSSYSVRVRTTNESSLSYEKAFTLQLLSTFEPDTTKLSDEICQGIPYNFHGTNLTATGIYRHTLQNITGCDSTVVLTLTVHPVSTTPIDASICQGGSYDFHGEILTSAGTYSKLLQSVSGCDSTVVLTLTVHPVSTTPINASICQGGSYDFHGEILTSAGTYSKLLQSVSGCDSTVVLTLTVHSLPVPSIIGETNVATASIKTYSTEAGMTDYSWTVSGGTITTGNYTNSINVTWGTGGTGQLSVNYINTYGCSAATPTIKTIYISDTDIDVLELLVNGISVDLFSMQIAMICEVVSVYIEVITTHSNAYITVNSQSYNGAMLPLTSPVTEFRIRISSENGASHKDLLLIVTKAFPVNDIFVLRFDNSVLSVINNPTNNGGYTFERYKWYQSGIEMPGENRGYINIDKPLGTIYTYRAELETTEGLIFNTCDFTRSTITSMKVYPNPVKNNTSLIIEVDWEKTWIIMYNLTGNVVKGPMQIKGPKDEISISGLPTGLYWLKATNALNTKEEAIKQILVE